MKSFNLHPCIVGLLHICKKEYSHTVFGYVLMNLVVLFVPKWVYPFPCHHNGSPPDSCLEKRSWNHRVIYDEPLTEKKKDLCDEKPLWIPINWVEPHTKGKISPCRHLKIWKLFSSSLSVMCNITTSLAFAFFVQSQLYHINQWSQNPKGITIPKFCSPSGRTEFKGQFIFDFEGQKKVNKQRFSSLVTRKYRGLQTPRWKSNWKDCKNK